MFSVNTRYGFLKVVPALLLVAVAFRLFDIQVIHTPGHTPGSCCYYLKDEDVLFSGDTLFCGSAGRTDFPGGSMQELQNSLNRLVESLPEETKVYPGHEAPTTIGYEKR